MKSTLALLALLVLSSSHGLPQELESAEHHPLGHYFEQFLAMFYSHSHDYEDENMADYTAGTDCKNESMEISTETLTKTTTTSSASPISETTTSTTTTTASTETTTSTSTKTSSTETTTSTTTASTEKTTSTSTSIPTTTTTNTTTSGDPCSRYSYNWLPHMGPEVPESRDPDNVNRPSNAEETGPLYCDMEGQSNTSPDWKGEGWYRFGDARGGGTGTRMMMQNPGQYACGALGGGWMNTPALPEGPEFLGEEVFGNVCFEDLNGTCSNEVPTMVVQCFSDDTYYLFYLVDVMECPYRYCGNGFY